MLVVVLVAFSLPLAAQQVTATLSGTVMDASGAVLPNATVKASNNNTGYNRSVTSSTSGDYQLAALPVGDYTVTVERNGFKKQQQHVTLQVGESAVLNFNLPVGEVSQQVEVQATSEALEPTRTMVSEVINQRQIESLPVNGRQFIDFALLAPGVTVGDTTSGSTDVIIEPVTKLSFASQNIHYNFIAIDGADNMSTASGIQKTTPSQEAVQEFRVINTTYSTEAGRAVGGIVNIITKSGTNNFHGSLYDYFRNDAMDARSILTSPNLPTCNVPGDASSGGCKFLKKLRQNQYGGTLGGPIVKDKTFFFANYEGQRRSESPFYNSAILANIGLINNLKCTNFGSQPCGAPGTLPQENLDVNRTSDYDNGLFKLDHNFTSKEYFFLRYFIDDQRLTKVSPLNDGFDMPSGFKDNFFRDQSIVGSLTSTLTGSLINEVRLQYAHRSFNFLTDTTQPHLEVSNIFTIGVNRGNPDFYSEGRTELVDNVTWARGKHTITFGGDYNHVNTTESFPLFYPFEADFGCITPTPSCANALSTANPFVIFFERFDATSNFTEPTINPAVYQGTRIPANVRNEAEGQVPHSYTGFYIQDKWRATDRLTLNAGVRYDFENWPSKLLNNDMDNFDPRAGLSYNLGTKWNLVFRAGGGIFHGTIPSPLLMCQIPSCGGVNGQFPGRENKEDSANANTRLFAYVPFDFISPTAGANAVVGLLNGTYPNPSFAGPTPGIEPDAVIVRFAKDHQAPYGIQASTGFEFEPFRDAIMSVSYLHVRGVHLGSFFNVNQPPPACQILAHDSNGDVGFKDDFHAGCNPAFGPGTLNPNFAVFFEADSKWDSVYDGLLVNFNKRVTHHFGVGVSYTWAKGLDNGPNPSFVLIPQDNTQFGQERAISSDNVAHRFVANGTIEGPTHMNRIVNGFQLSTIVSLESPHYFTKFAGFDANGDVFGNNDRVGIERRNTFKGDSYQSVDMRVSRTFDITERFHLQGSAEAFNLLNTVNIRFFNTAYGAADFCPIGGVAVCGFGPFFTEGSPNPTYGTPRAVFNPRQVQLALRLTF
jgi:hypothetical protein